MKKLLPFLIIILILPTVLLAQNLNYTIYGVVADSVSNQPVADVLVEVINEADTTEKAIAYTDSNGYYNANLIVSGIDLFDDRLPLEFTLKQNYPNPFNPTTIIGFQLPEASDVQLVVYNILGQKIKTIVDQKLEAGIYSAVWDGTNDNGQPVSSGVYYYQLNSGKTSMTRKMLLMK